MDDKKTVNRISKFIKDLIRNGYVVKKDFINELRDNTDSTISDSTWRRTRKDVEQCFEIPITYDKSNNKYLIDHENTRRKKRIKTDFFDQYSMTNKSLISDHELLVFYCFIKSMIDSEIYLPPLNTNTQMGSNGQTIISDYKAILRVIKKLLPEDTSKITDKIEYKMSEHYKTSRRLNFKNHISNIIQSFQSEKIIKFSYTSTFNENPKVPKLYTIEPIKLLHYSAKWYLIGYKQNTDKLRVFNLSYIKNEIKILHSENYKNDYASPDINELYGIILSEESKEAVIRFYPPINIRMEEIIWHKNQVTTTSKDSKGRNYTEFKFQFPHKYAYESDELIGSVLRYGCNVEIIEPEDLRIKWINEIKKMHKMYV